jgi:phenylacetate-CoA ligase
VQPPGRHYFEPEFETMAPQQMQQLQWHSMLEQLRRAAGTPFYRVKLEAAGLDVETLRTPADLAAWPLTTKEELCADIEAFPPYGSRLCVPRTAIVDIVETSGTSGLGKEVHVLTRADRHRTYRIEAFGFVWAGLRPGGIVALTLPVAMTAAGNWWMMTLDRLDAAVLRLGHMDVEGKLDYLLRYQPNQLIGTPAYVSRMERAAADRGVNLSESLPALTSILLSGEAKSPDWAISRSAAWGARMYEQWGSSAGAVAWCCEQGMVDGEREPALMHGIPHLTYLEVIDRETGRHVKDGEYGEIVITPLGSEGAPLARFATGDRARYLEAHHCRCGRPFPGLEVGSVSRYDDMVKVKGVNVWPAAVARLIEMHPEVTEHAVTVYADELGREQLRLDAVLAAGTAGAANAGLADSLQRELRAAIGVTFQVELSDEAHTSVAGDVLQAGSGKVRRWRDLRGAAG